MTTLPRPLLSLTALAFIATALTWGSSFLLIKVALDSFSPGQVALGRLVVGALTLVLLMVLTRRRWPSEPRVWAHLAVVAVFLCVAPFILFAWAGQFLPSGLSSILNATTPIWTAIFVSIGVRTERFTAVQVGGIVLGIVGVGVVTGLWRFIADPAFAASLPAQAACLAATACYGIGFLWLRKYVVGKQNHDSVVVAAVQIVLAAVMSIVIAPIFAMGAMQIEVVPVLALVALGVFGTGFAYVWNTRVVLDWGPVASSTVTYLTPVVGIVLGALILGEHITWNEPVGAVLIIVSVIVVQQHLKISKRLRGRRSTQTPEGTLVP
ncbi:DMT family transporter [Humidisolicoccus flavus]|uniref:DMT family transporter n=1 Tax=Humidisolicoccus flavus TaxID=3111414 RepID=UPI003249B4D2